MSDKTKHTIIHISGCHLGTTFPEVDFNKDVLGVNELERFLQEENYLTLYAIIEEIELNKKIRFFRKAEEKDYPRLVIFSKHKPCLLNEENLLSSTQVSSISGSPTLALYNSLSHVYTPLLDKEQHQVLQKHIHNMQAELRNSIFANNTDFLESTSISNSLSVVSSLDHEVQYWHMATTSTGKRDKLTKVACASFRDILTPLSRDFCVLEALSFLEVEDILERSHNVLDDLYRHEPPYPKERIRHLIDIVAQELCKFISKQMEGCQFWKGSYNEVMETVQQLTILGEKWILTCKQLTELFWPNYSGNIWREGIYVPPELESYIDILKEAINIRTVHKQLVRLLTMEEQEELKTKDIFKPFEDLNIFKYNELLPNAIPIAKKQFEILLQPAEKCVAMKLKKQLSTLNAHTRQLLYEFSRYSEIINRPILKQALLSERQYLLNSLFDYIRTLQPKANVDNVSVLHGTETSQVVKEIIMVRQLETRVKEIQKVAKRILDDLQGYDNIIQQVDELMHDLKQQHIELFQVWSSDTMALIKDNTLSLRESDPVVQFSQQKYMKVNYSSRFVMLINEVRQLRTMGFHIASQIQQTADHAKKFMKHARILEQIANFHNTIGDRMISSLKPLMLASALELSKLVQEQEVVSWGDEPSVEKYVNYLKKAVEKLSRENELLTMYHSQILEKITELNDVDLIKDYSKWKENTRQIRAIVSQVEDKGFKNMQLWKNDLDKRLCKTLEKQYIKSLDTVHLYLPEIYVDLVFRNNNMTFAPSEEQLKKQYDQQLKKFLELPKHFRGISDSSDISMYADIIDKNKKALEIVSKHTNELFVQLEGVKTHWQSWIQLEALDLSKLKSWQDWDLHFRSSKIFAQEVAKLPSTEEKVGCIIVGLSRLRSDLESHNRSYWDQLVYSLKDSILEDVVKLQNFVDASTAALTKQAVTLEELADSGISHSKIMKELPEMQAIFDEMLKKSQTLSSWSKEQIDSVNRLKGGWERLQSLISSHHLIIEKQMENVKMTLKIESENISKELEHFSAKWELTKPHQNMEMLSQNSIGTLKKYLEIIKAQKTEWAEIVNKKEKLISDYNKYNIDVPDIPLFNKIEEEFNKDEKNWNIFEEFNTELMNLTNEYWIVFRKKIYLFEDFLSKWEAQLKDVKSNELIGVIIKEIEKYKNIFPLLKYVRGEDFSEKHWMDVFNLLQMTPKPTDQLTLNDFLDASENIKNNVKQLQAISKKAASEIVVRQALAELDQWEIQARFVLNEHVDSQNKHIFLVKDFKEILNKIGDNQSLLQSVKNSTDYGAFADKTVLWENKLMDLEHYITSLALIQRKWVYLEPIFSSGTLAHEKQRFDRIDRDVRHILSFIQKDDRVGALCRFSNLRSLVDTILEQLARCQISLNNFLSEKRNKFPRFYFLSDDDLLEVVGQSSKEQVIQNHLKKLFAGINSIQLKDNKIVALCSSDKEVVTLVNPINIQQPVEGWLEALVKEMHLTLKELLVLCQNEKDAPDPLKYPSQILCLSDNINFTLKCEQAITSMTLPSLLNKYKTQLNHYSSLEIHSSEDKSFASMTNGEDESKALLEIKLKALLLDTIHHIHVLEMLIDSRTTMTTDWAWQKQLRYYSNSMGVVTVKMAKARMEYSYEYLGNAPKLVRTPLTERCFLTLTQGMHLGMGGNPYGPAGTGKTESVKALGQLLGRQVLVFNCDEGIDASSMARIISGLVRSGAWGCFDEFNRLEEATLSAVSMLIQPVQMALRNNSQTIKLQNQEIEVNKHCGIFVTLNPAGGGYGGRNKLPDNLKQLFRPVVMTHPDQEEIARSLLHCDGYQYASILAVKIIEVFDLSSKLLSNQQHYDWGLRAVRTILIGCRRSLKRYKLKTENPNSTMEEELRLVVEVLRMNTLSKLTFNDSVKFDSIIKDVFKDTELIMKYDNEMLIKCLEESFDDLNLKMNKRQINKCLEFYEQLKQRMGVAIVGPPSCGKSAIRNLLLNALRKMKKVLKSYPFNPKSMKRSQLLGYLDQDTKQWNDGVLTNYSLQVSSDNQDVWSWIVCDGDIDPDWIESLNSVLDDNRLLTLPSGWRIQFDKNVNFIFETHNLKHASPATISRMGIVFLSEEDLPIELYVEKFVQSLPEHNKAILEPLIQDYFVKVVNWIFSDGEITVPCSKLSVAKTGLSCIKNVNSKAEYAVALVNGLGQLLQDSYKETFVKQVFDWIGEGEPPLPLKCRYNKERDMIDSYMSNANVVIEDVSNGLPLILTGQVAKTLDVLRIWLESDKEPFLLVGAHGSAKMLILQQLVQERANTEILTIHCSSHLDPSYVINKLNQHCISINTHKGKLLKPKRGSLILFLKNLELLKPDKWESNILIEFINQIITYDGFYDSNIEFIRLENVLFVGSLVETKLLSERFTSNVHYYNVSSADYEDFVIVVTAYLSALLKDGYPNTSWPKTKMTKISMSLIEIYEKIRKAFTPVLHKHYTISPHDITKWCSSIIRYKNETFKDSENFILEILAFEALKLFGDKLTEKSEKERLSSIINETIHSNLGRANVTEGLSNYTYAPSPQVASSYSTLPLSKLKKDDWTTFVQQGITFCEREGQIVDLMVNEELLDLTSSISKTLSASGENLVLIGRSGIGRRSAIKIVTALMSTKLITPASESTNQLFLDLKMAMQLAGVDGDQVYLQIEDYILSKDKNMEIINMLISSGEVPGLYTLTELDSLVKNLKDDADRTNFEGSLLDFFNKRVQSNLHVVVCLDINNSKLWNILDECPVLIKNSTIIWRNEWSLDSINQLPNKIIEQFKQDNDGLIDVKLSTNFLKIYKIIDNIMPEPSRFVSMIKVYIEIYQAKALNITSKQNKLKAGISKLKDAKQLVNELKLKADEQQQKLADKQGKANSALDMISNTMKNANNQKEVMESLKSKTETENVQLVKRKKEIEEELAEVEPLVQEARSAVGNIKSESLSEIRSLRAPPDVIRDILEGVLRLMGIQDTSWNSMKTFLAKRGVKEDIRSFDAGRITTANRLAVEKLMTTKSESFDPKVAKRASLAAAPLAAWVIANVKYSHVMDKIRPLEKEQNKLQKNLEEAEVQLEELSTGLSDVDATVKKLKEKLSAYTKEAAEIEIDLNSAKETLSAAEGLVLKLNDEFERWQVQYRELTEEYDVLPTNCLLAAAFITYLSQYSEHKRITMLEEWLKATETKTFTFEQFLSTEREQLMWQSQGLPSDKLSMQNAISILKSSLVPLIIDPSSTAINWLKQCVNSKNIEYLSQTSTKFNTSLELAIRFGKTLIIEETEQVPTVIYPILRREFLQQGERRMIKLNGKQIDYNCNFKLILCSRNEQLQLPADVVPLINVFSFTVTNEGLTDQLLFGAIKQENPDLENRRKLLLSEREKMQDKQEHYQNQLLEDLANSSGDILQNKSLIQSLNETKASSSAIVVALAESLEIQKKMQQEYDAYTEISAFGSNLYFSCNEFSRSSILYLISVSAFTRLFLQSLESLQVIERNTQTQIKNLFSIVYNYMARGIFKQDRLKFIFHLANKLFPKDIPETEWNVYLNNRISNNRQTTDEIPSWIPKHCVSNVLNLITGLPDFFNSLKLNESHIWSNFMNSNECESNFPSHLKLTEFQRILIIQALRPDRLYSAMVTCIIHITGLKTLNPPNFELSHILKESISSEPVLVLSMPGTDPSTEIKDLAQYTIGNDNYVEIAMGEGQEDSALQALKETVQSGQWLILKNLHLATNWLPILCQSLKDMEKHENFRLWLISEPTNKFSTVLTQNSLKIVYEAPQGIKNNLQRSLISFGNKFFENLNASSAKIFFVVCCVHALLQERRKYIPQGWSKYYEFSDTDLSTCVKLVEDLWQNPAPQIRWKFISGLCAETVYGGRIENLDDMKILDAYVKQYFVDEILSHRWKPFGIINLPNSANYNDYLNSVIQLPMTDSPSYFGLSANIDRSWEIQNSATIIKGLKDLYIHKQSFTNFDREIFQRGLMPFMNLWKKLNQGYDFIRMTVPQESLKQSAVETFIFEEFVDGLQFVHSIHKCFAYLNKICKGHISPTKNDVAIGSALLNYETPCTWMNIWSGPKEPMQYLKSVIRNLVYLSKINEENIKNILSNPINLSLFFNPQKLLASHKQDVSRMSNIAIDQLHLQTSWKMVYDTGITLTDLLVEGAVFEGTNLKSCANNSDNINSAPKCYLHWKPKNIEEDDKYLCVSLYTRSDRECKLISLNIFDESKDKDKWILCNLAFFLEV